MTSPQAGHVAELCHAIDGASRRLQATLANLNIPLLYAEVDEIAYSQAGGAGEGGQKVWATNPTMDLATEASESAAAQRTLLAETAATLSGTLTGLTSATTLIQLQAEALQRQLPKVDPETAKHVSENPQPRREIVNRGTEKLYEQAEKRASVRVAIEGREVRR